MFILFVCLSHRGRLIGVKLVKMPKPKFVRHFSTDRALYSDKARSFSQSERALYRNFIINAHNWACKLDLEFEKDWEPPALLTPLVCKSTAGSDPFGMTRMTSTRDFSSSKGDTKI